MAFTKKSGPIVNEGQLLHLNGISSRCRKFKGCWVTVAELHGDERGVLCLSNFGGGPVKSNILCTTS